MKPIFNKAILFGLTVLFLTACANNSEKSTATESTNTTENNIANETGLKPAGKDPVWAPDGIDD
ncbi:MAG TPA: hypothetical protein VM888_02465, partial [Chitinophagaceae bacterium]|nr:hypothetical protein [Chitinophagaceae bacterium]